MSSCLAGRRLPPPDTQVTCSLPNHMLDAPSPSSRLAGLMAQGPNWSVLTVLRAPPHSIYNPSCQPQTCPSRHLLVAGLTNTKLMASPPCPSPPRPPGSPGHPPLTSSWQPRWAPSPPHLLSWPPAPCSLGGWGWGSCLGPTEQKSPPWPLAKPSASPHVAPGETRQPLPKQGSQLSSAAEAWTLPPAPPTSPRTTPEEGVFEP